MNPKELKYTDTHEWVKVEGDIATIGVTDFAQKQMSDVVYVENSSIGKEIAINDKLAVLDSVKASSELYSPLSGVITEVNPDLEESPELINDDPYGRGWIVKIKLSNVSELDSLLLPEDYEKKAGE